MTSDNFFGNILDPIRGIGDDVSEFFNSTMGLAIANGVKAGYSSNKQDSTRWNEYFNNETVKYSPSNKVAPAESEDFTKLELEWLQRLHRFSGMSTGTEVKLGSR